MRKNLIYLNIEQIYSYKALLQTLLQACLLTPLKHKEQGKIIKNGHNI